jgi:sugar lactone lactonase YvrE
MRCVTCLVAAGLSLACVVLPFAASAQSASSQYPLVDVYANRHFQLTGISVSKDSRLFVNFPRWSDRYLNAVIEVQSDGTERPFPNTEWNRWDNKPATAGNHFVCVQSVYTDRTNSLWVVDAAAPLLATPVPGGPKLVKIDLATNEVTQVIRFGPDIAIPDSYLNDVRIDNARNFAYMTDSGHGGIVVVDIANERAWRKLDGHLSVMADPNLPVVIDGRPVLMANGKPATFNSDSLEMSKDGNTLFYKPVNSTTLWSVPTELLRDESASAAAGVKAAATNLFPTDGLWLDSKGRIYLTDLDHEAVKRLTLGGALETVVQSERLQWPDTFTEDPEGNIYVSISRIHQQPMFNEGYSRRHGRPFRVFRIPNADPQ